MATLATVTFDVVLTPGSPMTVHDQSPHSDVTRRSVLRTAAVGGIALPLLAACGGGSAASPGSAPSDPASSSSGGASGGSGGGTTVAASDVPVGGGTILADQQLVVTQPTKGDFKAFSAICTHQGCPVNQVAGGQIICPCHGSQFSITDGSPVAGPAQSPLASKKVTVKGDQISVS